MPSVYPGALDALTNPLPSNPLTAPSHASQHTDANDCIEAIEGNLGLNPQGAYATVAARLAAMGGGDAVDTVATTPFTLTSAHRTVLVDASAAAVTINLPAAASSTLQRYEIKKIDASVNSVTVDANGVETIDGATTVVLTTQYASIAIACNGTSWYLV